MTRRSPSDYRPDIDGLRAVAVVAVVLFHLDGHLVPGGFTGVDIFFVISGFLISLRIYRELEARDFSVVRFYRRRVARIVPAALATILLTAVAAQAFFRPEDAETASRSAFWSIFSVANVFFAHTGDYFAPPAGEMPLLHMWSLSVEEQFYVLWPLLLIVAWACVPRSVLRFCMIVTIVLSTAAAEMLSRYHPNFSYYMLPTRCGELIIGSLTAYWSEYGRVRERMRPGMALALSGTGLTAILAPMFLINETDVFPGILALPSSVGTALILFAGDLHGTPVRRLLSNRALTIIGLMSYSLYLIHWPVLSLYRYGYGQPGILAKCALLAAIGGLAWLSYRYVETPGRKFNISDWKYVVYVGAIPSAAIALLLFASIKERGMVLHTLSPSYESRLSAMRSSTARGQALPAYEYPYVCQRQRLEVRDLDNPACQLGPSDSKVLDILLWGDSHAAQYVGIIGAIAEKGRFSFRNIEVGSCPPLLDDFEDSMLYIRRLDCRASRILAKRVIERSSVVLIGGYWTSYAARSAGFLDELRLTLETLVRAKKKVVLLGQVPEQPGFDRLCEEKALSYPYKMCDDGPIDRQQSEPPINRALQRMVKEIPGVAYFDITNFLCDGNSCSRSDASGAHIYYDASHLSIRGSSEIGRQIVDRVGVPAEFANAIR